MLSLQGMARRSTARTVVVLTLACVAGMVNAIGFFAVGTYTSHVTGHLSHFGDHLAQGKTSIAIHALLLVLSFVAGAFSATLFVETARRIGKARYSLALAVVAGVLAAFSIVSALFAGQHGAIDLVLTAILCFAMGMQNALVTRVSNAVVRPTHMTGVATDIGIELARLVIWLRHKAKITEPIKLIIDLMREEELRKLWLHLALFFFFTTGAFVGPFLYMRHGHAAMLLPGLLILGLVLFDWLRWLRQARLNRIFPLNGAPVAAETREEAHTGAS